MNEENIYKEPSNLDYIIVPIKEEDIASKKGSLYDTARKPLCATLEDVKPCKYVFAVVQNVVKEVYEVEKWQKCDEKGKEDCVTFEGRKAEANVGKNFEGKMIPKGYRARVANSPFVRNGIVDGERDTLIRC